jgi:hypothetical protein
MAQPISTIAENVCDTPERFRGDSVSSMTPLGEASKRVCARWEVETTANGLNEAILDLQPAAFQSSTDRSPPTVPAIADLATPRMAPGIGGFNIDPPRPRASLVDGDTATTDMRPGLMFNPEHVRSSALQPQRKAIVKIDGSSLVFTLLLIAAIFGLALLGFRDDLGKLMGSTPPSVVLPLHAGLSVARPMARPVLVVTESQKGFANEPLPLGIWLKNASGEETVTITGLANGTDLSLGTSHDLAGWLLSASDLDKAFVGPPKDFVGVMDATVKLSSANGQLLESQVIRLEWIAKKEEGLSDVFGASEPAPVAPSLNADQIAELIKLGEDLLGQGDIATARLLFKRAAIAGNAQAALELGITYDPVFQALSGVAGMAPDAAQARAWYDKAVMLGSAEASRGDVPPFC